MKMKTNDVDEGHLVVADDLQREWSLGYANLNPHTKVAYYSDCARIFEEDGCIVEIPNGQKFINWQRF